jgi:UDP-N-acetylglucosamine 2-epimerase (non-hydrolysing)
VSRLPVAVVLGTRPEAIKLAPVVAALERSSTLRPVVVDTGQHRDLLAPLLPALGLRPDHRLDLFTEGQALTDLLGRAVSGLGGLVRAQRTAIVLVQGDTASALAGALAGFHEQTPVGHVEAGLRTGEPFLPFPEETYRRLITRLSTLHFAPTALAQDRLLAEGVPADSVLLSGNTVIDTLRMIVARGLPTRPAGRRLALLTVHRRETWGEPLHRIAAAVGELARTEPGLDVVFPAHPNPAVRLAFAGLDGVQLVEPLPYDRFVGLLATADVVLTDSGGIQEEAPSLGIPVVLLRDITERPEAVAAGFVEIAGTDPGQILDAARRALAGGRPAPADLSPFGDGFAAERIVGACDRHLGPVAVPGVDPSQTG